MRACSDFNAREPALVGGVTKFNEGASNTVTRVYYVPLQALMKFKVKKFANFGDILI